MSNLVQRYNTNVCAAAALAAPIFCVVEMYIAGCRNSVRRWEIPVGTGPRCTVKGMRADPNVAGRARSVEGNTVIAHLHELDIGDRLPGCERHLDFGYETGWGTRQGGDGCIRSRSLSSQTDAIAHETISYRSPRSTLST